MTGHRRWPLWAIIRSGFDRVVATDFRFAAYRAGADRRITVVALRRV